MNMKKTYMMAALAAAFSVPHIAGAQNLDPTVEVSRAYEGKLMEVHKPALEMAVPDSVMKFDLEFDYSVFESPYKGSYEFNPYSMSLHPDAPAGKDDCLYLKAGAGYTLHPVLDVVWSPRTGKSFGVDVYGTHRSYIGKYYDYGLSPQKDAVTGDWAGNDFLSRAGADFRFDWKNVELSAGAGYYGLHRKNRDAGSGYNAVEASARLRSKQPWHTHSIYEAGVSYRYGSDRMTGFTSGRTGEHNFNVDATFAPAMRGKHGFAVDFALEVDAYSGWMSASMGEIAFAPRYVFRHKWVSIDAGVRFPAVMFGDIVPGQVVYPDITAKFDVLKETMGIYLRVGGGNSINTYSSLLSGNHHLTMASGPDGVIALEPTVESVSLILGLEGRICSRFGYNIRGGYVHYANALLDALWTLPNDSADSEDIPPYALASGIGYSSYAKWFAAFDWNWKAERFTFDGSLNLTSAGGDCFTQAEMSGLLRPAAFTGDVAFEYNIRKRVFLGVDCLFSTARAGWVRTGEDAVLMEVPGYADLGVNAEYWFGHRLSVWARGGNLLNMRIQRNPLYAEKGMNFTAGICLNL